ncbi:hypothetical protein NIES2104_58800 [Leptolyngbya sp. NIES-2104]|nr:hypothetical protein NIES2104_58800 [Leptolyngbya sp. NIES-2104]
MIRRAINSRLWKILATRRSRRERGRYHCGVPQCWQGVVVSFFATPHQCTIEGCSFERILCDR